MSSYQTWRDEFVAAASKQGLPLETVQKLLRSAQTYQRLAERECNGEDWQTGWGLVACPNTGCSMERDYCPYCGTVQRAEDHTRVTLSSLRMHRLEQRWAKQLPAGFSLSWSGDPRGAVCRLLCPDGSSNGWGDGLAVPTRY